MFYNPSSVRSGVFTRSKSDLAKSQSESLRSAFKTIKIAEKSRLARTKSVNRLPNRPSKKPMAPKSSTEPGPSSQDRGGTNASEPTVKNGTSVFPSQHFWNPSATYSGEKGDGQYSMPAATSLWSVPEFDPSRTEEADAGAKSPDPSEAEAF